MAKSWFRRKKGKLLFCYYNASGSERAKMLGPEKMTDGEAWVKVGELGFGKLTGKPDPANVTFGGLLEHYLGYGRKKTGEAKAHSSRNTEARNVRLHLNHWAERVAKGIEPLEIQRWLDQKTQGLRSKTQKHDVRRVQPWAEIRDDSSPGGVQPDAMGECHNRFGL
jgi:hypothetical protein